MPSGTTDESFSNPLAPPGETVEDSKPQKLTNADFRKLLMTPRTAAPSVKETTTTTHPTTGTKPEVDSSTKNRESKEDIKASERKKKKSYYAKIKKEEEQKMAELAEKYRDRARERREGKNPDYQAEDPTGAGMGAYRAVAPDLKSGFDAAERRKQMIQESKFLGGDMEHTHLVKGLDYALLQKVRSEIIIKEQEIDIPMEKPPAELPKERKPIEEEELTFTTGFGKRIFNTIFHGKNSDFNDTFQPGRVAYSIDLEEDNESDIPITVIRSKADMMGVETKQATFTTNDIVIQKLTQILSYLRTGRTSKKQKKKDKGREPGKNVGEDSIYGEIGDYIPNMSKPDRERDRGRDRERERDRRDRERYDKEREKERDRNEPKDKRRSYFSRPAQEEANTEMRAAEDRLQEQSQLTREQAINKQALLQRQRKVTSSQWADQYQYLVGAIDNTSQSRFKKNDYYTECYPGMAEMQDAIEDSDDEADYTKMDLGNKKGPVGRWDFDTQEEYSDYMNQREAMPKAAFQYGVKMADGRKTRRIGGKEKDRNAELNREWQQIQQILKKRKENDIAGVGDKKARYDY